MTNEMLQLLKTRRSVRKYKPDPVEPEKLDAVLEAGTYAPSAMGKQSATIVAVQDPETRNQLMKMNAAVMGIDSDPYYGAPTIVLVLGSSVEDGSCVLLNMMNAAHSLGLASCWIHREREMFDSPEGKGLLKKWGLPEGLRGIGSIALGYADGEPPAPKLRKEGYIVKI